MGRLQSLHRWLKHSPEIPTMIYLFGLMFYGPTVEQYVYKMYSDELGYNYTINGGSSSGNCPANETKNSTNRMLQKEVQGKVAQYATASSFCQSMPPMFLLLFYGPLTDQIGRKPVMVFCLFCNVLAGILILLIQCLTLPVWWLYVANFIMGLGGFFMSLVMAVCAYLCDIIEGKDRALRMAIIDLMVFIAITISNYTSGAFLERFGFRGTFVFVLVLLIFPLLYTIFILEESLPEEKRVKTPCCMFPVTVFKVLIKSRPHRWKLMLFAAITTLQVLTSPSAILVTIMLYLMNVPLCWSPGPIGFYRGTYFLVIGIGTVVGVKLFSKIFSTTLTLLVSTLSAAGFLISIAFSHTTATLYLSIIAGLFSFVAPCVIRGAMSQLVTEREQGSLFAILGSLQSLFLFLSSFMYQSIYKKLNDNDIPGGVFIVGSFTSILPIVLIITYWFKDRHSPAHSASEFYKDNDEIRNVLKGGEPDETKPLLS